jgi:hypothetical protein
MIRPAIVCLAALLGPVAAGEATAQNVLGAERAPANPAEVQQQLERQRHDLDAMNQRTAKCEQQRAAEGKPLIGEPPSRTGGLAVTDCAP